MLTRRELKETFGSDDAIAKLLGITLQAVRKWPLDGPIPKLREVQFQTMFPKKFGQPRAEVGEDRSYKRKAEEMRAA